MLSWHFAEENCRFSLIRISEAILKEQKPTEMSHRLAYEQAAKWGIVRKVKSVSRASVARNRGEKEREGKSVCDCPLKHYMWQIRPFSTRIFQYCFILSELSGNFKIFWFTVRFGGQIVGPWVDTQDRESHGQTVRVGSCDLIAAQCGFNFWDYGWNPKVWSIEQYFAIQWNPAQQTPGYNGESRLSRRKAHVFSLKLTVNTDNGHFSGSRLTNSHTSSTPLTDTGYLHTVYFHCHNYVMVDIVPCSNNDRFLRVNTMLLLKNNSKIAWHPWSATFLPVFDPCTVVLQ